MKICFYFLITENIRKFEYFPRFEPKKTQEGTYWQKSILFKIKINEKQTENAFKK